jgi:hypothetical protein
MSTTVKEYLDYCEWLKNYREPTPEEIAQSNPHFHPVVKLWSRVGTMGQSGDYLSLWVCPACGAACAAPITHYDYHKAKGEMQ